MFIAVFWLAGSDPCSARIVMGPQSKSAVPTLGNLATLTTLNLSLNSLAPLGAPSLFSAGTLPTLKLPVAAQVRKLQAPAVPRTNAAAPARADKKKSPVLANLQHVVGRMSHGRGASPVGLLRRFFDANLAGNFADDPVEAAPKPTLPPYIKIANKEAAEYLAAVHETALRSPTAQKVLKEIAEYTGNGREPVIFEIADSDGGSFTFAWEVVRLSQTYKDDSIEKAAAAMIHELVHVLQKGKDLPFNGIELEIEAHITQFKVARELGVAWSPDDYHHGAFRSLKASLEGFVAYLLDSPSYSDSISLVGNDFRHAEEQLRKMEKSAQRAITNNEPYLKEREMTLRVMRALGYDEKYVKAYRGDEVLAVDEVIVSNEVDIHGTRRDLRILRTPIGRQRYIEFARNVLKDARQFRELINRSDRSGVSRKKARLQLPTRRLVEQYEPLPEPAPRKEAKKKDKRYKFAEAPGPASKAFKVIRKSDEEWFRGLLDAVRESETGRKYLEAVERRALRAARGGRPWLVEFFDGTLAQGSQYYSKFDILQLNRAFTARPPRDFAPEFVQLLSDVLHENRVISYALETEIEGYTSAFMVARELGIAFAKSNPMYAGERKFRGDFSKFIQWMQKRDPSSMLVARRDIDEIETSIRRRRAVFSARLKTKKEYLKERRATARLMKRERINFIQQRFFKADEVIGTEAEVLALEATIDEIDKDLARLANRIHADFYRKYAKWATDRAREYHRIYNRKPD